MEVVCFESNSLIFFLGHDQNARPHSYPSVSLLVFCVLYKEWQINKSMYEQRKNRSSKCVCFTFWKAPWWWLPIVQTQEGNLCWEQRPPVSVPAHKAVILVHSDLSDYPWAEPKSFSSFFPGSVNLGCLVCFKARLRHIIWLCTSVNYYSNSLYVY